MRVKENYTLFQTPQGSENISSHHVREPAIELAAEKALVRKLDKNILPLIMLLYLLCFLDRSNIGNARLFGLEKDLGMHGNMYQLAVSLLFASYITTELPSNLIIKRLRPSRWIAFIATFWGVVATLTGTCSTYGGLLACRLVLGALEGGFFPGLTIYLTLFYSKKELAMRVCYVIVSGAVSGAFGGLLAYAIGNNMDGTAGQRAWRWIMIFQGLPTVILGISTWWLLADEPDVASYLTDNDKELMRVRRARHLGETESGKEQHWADVSLGLKDWKIWAFAVGQFGSATALYGYTIFLPTIIKGIDSTFSDTRVQLLTVPCYVAGSVSYLTCSYISDRIQQRGIFAAALGLVSVVGYAMLMSNGGAGVHYAGCLVVALGLYVVLGIPLAWLPTNQPRYGKRTTASGLQLTIGNVAGISAPFLYPTADSPRFLKGHATTMALVAMSSVIFAVMTLYFTIRNKSRQAGKEDYKIEGMSEEQIAELGDESPRFVFTA